MQQIRILCAAVCLIGLATTAHAKMLKREPPLGALKPGQVALVDDGVCPKGQVKRVVGGDHVKVGGRYQTERQRSCVPK
jgi:hypothetical protein